MSAPSQRLAQVVQDGLETRWRQQVQTAPFLGHQVGALSAWLVSELQEMEQTEPVEFGFPAHLAPLGLALEAVVAEFNVLRSCVFELATVHQIPVEGALLVTVNRVVDSAIAAAVKALAEQQTQRREESLALAVHDLRTPLTAFSMATDLLERLVHPVAESEIRALLDIMRSSVRKQDYLFHRVLADDHPSAPDSGPDDPAPAHTAHQGHRGVSL